MFPTTLKFLVVSVVLSLVAACGGSDPSSNPPPAAPPPTLTSVSPNSSPVGGGTTVYVEGNGFQKGAVVDFNGAIASGTVVSATQIVVASPPSPVSSPVPASVTVRVTNPDGQSARLVNGFVYQPIPQEFARSIMGANFFGVEENAKYFGISVSPSDPAYYNIPYAEATLREKASTHMLVLVPRGYSILDLQAKLPAGVIAFCDAWNAGEAFASDKGTYATGWHLIRRDLMPGSLGIVQHLQDAMLFGTWNYFPYARPLVFALAGHYMATGEVLLPGVFSRTADFTYPPGTTYLKTVFAGGNAYGAKVGICSDWGETADPTIGVAEERNPDGALP